jgi:ArsR family transcriptional regulator
MRQADIFKALADETRLRIVRLLMLREMCVCELETLMKLPQPNVSRHLIKLKQAGVIESIRYGTWIYYHMNHTFLESNRWLIDACGDGPDWEQEPYMGDRTRYQRYIKYGFSCQDISLDKIRVSEIIYAD